MAPTRSARNPNLLEEKSFHVEYRPDAFFGDMCYQDAPSGVAASSTTRAPTATASEDTRHAVDQETAVWPTAMAPPYPDEQYPWPQSWPQTWEEQPPKQRCTRRSIFLLLLGLGLVVILIVALVVSQTVMKREEADPSKETGEGPHRDFPVSPAAPTTTTTTTTVCGRLVARMVINKKWQHYDDNQPDQKMWGIANTTVCIDNGTVRASALLTGGTSKLKAGQIRRAADGTDGADGRGDVVYSFCGSTNDDISFEEVLPCGLWSLHGMVSKRTSSNENMEGKPNRDLETAMDDIARAKDMLNNPQMYYFSFTTDTSFNNTCEGQPCGAIRGQLEKRD